jgi:vacuolar protein sorting-associated protein 45
MSIIKAVSDYVSSVLARVSGMKVLLVDSETVGIVSMVLSHSQILEQEVFLIEVLDNPQSSDSTEKGHNMKHLKGVAILRPSASNFLSLSKELKTPRFSEYHLCMLHFRFMCMMEM